MSITHSLPTWGLQPPQLDPTKTGEPPTENSLSTTTSRGGSSRVTAGPGGREPTLPCLAPQQSPAGAEEDPAPCLHCSERCKELQGQQSPTAEVMLKRQGAVA